ncbi:MAG: hypothetical protein ACI83D_000471, partial [Planctomycetota bacterium]
KMQAVQETPLGISVAVQEMIVYTLLWKRSLIIF